jgi:hypothetical protein
MEGPEEPAMRNQRYVSWLATDRNTVWRSIIGLGVGTVLGLFLSVIPPIAFLLLGVISLAVVGVTLCIYGWRCDAATVVPVTCIVLAICACLPLKQLDVEVGPIAYDDLSLTELCDRLNADYGIICRVLDRRAQSRRLSFFTDQPLSRRKVLEKLSRDTNRPLHIGYCGTNATVLFGADPSFTYLGTEEVYERQ